MPENIACICGYRGPSVAEGSQAVCPICRTPARAASARPPAVLPPVPAAPAAQNDDWTPRAPDAAKPVTYRIPCPRGHVLNAAESMLDQQVVCPKCNDVFVLRMENSREYLKERRKVDIAREEEMARKWLTRAVWAAVFIVASLAGMIAVSLYYR